MIRLFASFTWMRGAVAFAAMLATTTEVALALPARGGLRPALPWKAGARLRAPGSATTRGKVGSSNVTTADMPVRRPETKPCVVPLFAGLQFEDFSPKPFAFTPPASCPRPWAKVVLQADISVTAGRQFDRTATIGLGGATIYFGTTAEPRSNLAPSWHIERDLTDLSALFGIAQNGQVSIFNVVNGTYTGIIGASASIAFYPPDRRFPAPLVADIVVPLADANGNPVALNTTADTLTASFTPPTNVTRAYLDVMAQSQSTDEFWYTCVPNNLTAPLNDCGNTAFRETEVSVDTHPAGVAPVYPWIYTGGIDPFLWEPTPGVQTLNFIPYRVDLTPFAGTLDDGASHSVGISVFNADNYFSATGNLLLFLDHRAKGPLTGGLDSDTLSATPPEAVTERGTFAPNGIINTSSHRSFVISGHVTTARGTIRTVVSQAIDFDQHQAIVNAATLFSQKIEQDTNVTAQTTRSGHEAGSGTSRSTFDYPLDLDYVYAVANDGSATQTTTIRQRYVATTNDAGPAGPAGSSFLSNTVSPTDQLHFDAGGNFTGNTNASNTQVYRYRNSKGACYGKAVTSANNVVASISKTRC